MGYLLVRCLLGGLMVLARREVSKDAELLVLQHENAVLRRQTGQIRYQPGDRLWLAALSRLIPQSRWGEVFAVTPATLLAWHRRGAVRQIDLRGERVGFARLRSIDFLGGNSKKLSRRRIVVGQLASHVTGNQRARQLSDDGRQQCLVLQQRDRHLLAR